MQQTETKINYQTIIASAEAPPGSPLYRCHERKQAAEKRVSELINEVHPARARLEELKRFLTLARWGKTDPAELMSVRGEIELVEKFLVEKEAWLKIENQNSIQTQKNVESERRRRSVAPHADFVVVASDHHHDQRGGAASPLETPRLGFGDHRQRRWLPVSEIGEYQRAVVALNSRGTTSEERRKAQATIEHFLLPQ